MIEWYLDIIVVSMIYFKGVGVCINYVEFYYFEVFYKDMLDYFVVEKVVYMEIVEEDEEVCLLLEKGWWVFYLLGEEEYGFIELFLEVGVVYFYDWFVK